jgi:hypothetical protein
VNETYLAYHVVVPNLKRPAQRTIFLHLFTTAASLVCAVSGQTTPALPSAAEVVANMQRRDSERISALLSYTAQRRYRLVNERFHKSAEIVARVQYEYPGTKTFDIVSQEGSGMIRKRVLERVMKAEEEASGQEQRQLSRIDLTNYSVQIAGTETVGGHLCFVLDLTAKSNSPYLVNGHAWVSSADYALVRIQGTPAKKPSIWAGTPQITQDYVKEGVFWLPHESISTTNAPIFGPTSLHIETSEYEVRPAQLGDRAIALSAVRD